ncbi:MAG: diguanylate cyclase [Acidobacteriia bacterium]|nr:diguanylate cyclase [Terriglobia bacterium]
MLSKPSQRLIVRHFLLSFAFLLLYLLLNRPEVILLSHLGFTAWYPATGLVLAVLLGISPWYAFLVCFADTLAGTWIYHQPIAAFGGTMGAAGIAICYAAAAYVLRGPLSIDLGLRRRRDVVRYVFVTVAAAMVATAIGVLCLVADHSIQWSAFWASAVGWFFGDTIGLLGIAPFLLVHVLPWVRRQLSASVSGPTLARNLRRKTYPEHAAAWLEAVGQAAALIGVLWVMFGRPNRPFYIGFVPIIWIAMRQGIRRVVTGVLALNFGIVVAMHIFPPTPAVLSKVGLFMLVVSAVGLIVGSEVTERHRMGLELHERTFYLNSLIENSPLGIVVLDGQGRVELTNPALERLFLYDQRELAGSDPDRLLSPEGLLDGAVLATSRALAGQTLHENVKRRRKDGTVLDLEMHAVPLMVDGQVQGAYTIYQDISEQVKAAEAERQHAKSLNQLVSELELRTSQMTLLNEMGSLLDCCGTVKEACAVVCRFAQRLFPGAASGVLYLFKSSRNLVEAAVHWGQPSVSEPQYTPDACWALRRGQPHWSESHEASISCSHLMGKAGGRYLCLPMVGQGDTLGVFLLEFAGSGGGSTTPWTEERMDSTQRLAMTAAGQVALSLASLRLREALRDLSIRDPLTGLFNRRFMEESLERELQRATRRKHPVSVLFLDLDHFKKFNDTFGHDAGDLVLRSVAELFRNFFRSDDIICRFGGEEFAIILPESAAQHAVARANHLREEVKQLKLRYNGQALDTVTVSIGIATFPEHGLTSDELLRVADRCLYQSKKSGRDVVTVAAHSVGAGVPAPAKH